MILIAGATGYVGRYFCKYLVDKGKDILALGRSKEVESFFKDNSIPFQYFDILDDACYEKLPKKGVDCVINLAAVLAEIETPVEVMFNVNTIGTYKLLEYSRVNNIKKFILSSSHKVYNDINHVPIKESDYPSFRGDHSPYIISKIAAENFVEYFNKDFDMQGIILRFTGVHGYGEILGKLSPDGSYMKSAFEIFVEKAINGEPIEVWGDCKAVRDHIYIKDLIMPLDAVISSENAIGVYNIATGVGLTLLQEVEGIIEVFSSKTNKSQIIRRPEKPAFTRSYVYDIDKAKHNLNWELRYSYIEMLQDYKRELEIKKYHHYHYIKEKDKPATI